MALSPSAEYLSRYGLDRPQTSPELAFQQTYAKMAGQDILDGKFGGGLAQQARYVASGGAMGGSGGGGGLGGTYQNALDAYNAAQLKSSGLINQGYADRRKAAEGLFLRTGKGELNEIAKKWAKARGEINSDFDSRGIYNAHQGDTKEIKFNQNEDLTRAQGEIIQKQALLDAQLSKDGLDYRERDAVRDTPPDINQMIGLESQMGAGDRTGLPMPQAPVSNFQQGQLPMNSYQPRTATARRFATSPTGSALRSVAGTLAAPLQNMGGFLAGVARTAAASGPSNKPMPLPPLNLPTPASVARPSAAPATPPNLSVPPMSIPRFTYAPRPAATPKRSLLSSYEPPMAFGN